MKKSNEIPTLSAEELKQQVWETLLLAKSRKLSADACRGVVTCSNGLLSIVKLEQQAAKQNRELGTDERPLLTGKAPKNK